MLELEFREWLEAGGEKTRPALDTRIYAVRTIEKNLAALGSPHADLASAYAADGFAQLRERIKGIRSNAQNGGDEYRVLMPGSEQPVNRLSSWNNWLAQYGRFLDGDDAQASNDDSQADKIRDYVLKNYIGPARARGDSSVTVVAGRINKEMGLDKAWTNICQVLEGQRFQDLAGVSPPLAEGTKQSTTRKFTFILSEEYSAMAQPNPFPTNLILYGPPGTGKTYHTAREAVALCDGIADYPASAEGRQALMARYNELVAERRIGFVTFHQNYGYEDFVEGLRPVAVTNSDGESVGFHLQPEPGIFRQIAERATERLVAGNEAFNLADRPIYKMSLGNTADAASDFVFTESIAGGYALLGFHDVDWSDSRFEDRDEIFSTLKARFPDKEITPNKGSVQSPDVFRNQLEIGDVLIVSKGNRRFRAIGIVEGDYEYVSRPDGQYCHRRKVKWLWHDKEGLDAGELYPPKFVQRTIYRLKDVELNRPLIAQLISDGNDAGDLAAPLPHVLIIDEINRANISKVFGELITLLEPDKRLGMSNALTVTLPYSKKKDFGIPANLHIIGTMNTADRSIALLDTALRRRFSFREMAPEPGLLGIVEGIDLGTVLATINRRIEYLIDREHRIGHAFFIACKTREQVEDAMHDKVIPLLQEYFFEDWSRIAAVLGDGFIRAEKLDAPPGIEGDSISSWSVLSPFKDDAFERLVGKSAAAADSVFMTTAESGA